LVDYNPFPIGYKNKRRLSDVDEGGRELKHPVNLNSKIVTRHESPVIIATGRFFFRYCLVNYLNKNETLLITKSIAIVFLTGGLWLWWLSSAYESSAGVHVSTVQHNFRSIYIRFLLSEIRLFVAFF